MINAPTPEVPKPSYQAREMDEKARKEREDKQRKLVLQKRDLEIRQMELSTQEDKHSALRREIARLENQAPNRGAAKTKFAVDIKSLESKNAARILEDEKKIKTLEQEATGVVFAAEARGAGAIAQKEQEEKRESQIIDKIKEEIRLKTLELEKLEDLDKALKQEILQLKKTLKDDQGSKKAEENKKAIEKLKAEIAKLNQDFELKKQDAERTNDDLLEKQKQSEDHQKLVQQKTAEAVLAVNRINALKEEIKMIETRIQTLEK